MSITTGAFCVIVSRSWLVLDRGGAAMQWLMRSVLALTAIMVVINGVTGNGRTCLPGLS